jgi:hypothetical protein
MHIGKLRVIGLAILSLAVSGLAFASVQASAFVGHVYVSSFGPGGPGIGSFSDLQGIAVDQSSESVYVLDRNPETERGLIYKFNLAGEPQEFTGLNADMIEVNIGYNNENQLAVDSSAGPAKGDLYYAHGGNLAIYGSDGDRLGALPVYPCGVAVSANGNVYLGEGGGNVYEYAPSTNPVTGADYVSTLAVIHSLCNIAADSEGNVYLDSWQSGPVTKYAAPQFGEPVPIGTPVDARGITLAVAPLTNDVYIDEGDDIAEYDPSGNLVSTFAAAGAGAITGSDGVAVYEPTLATTAIYAADNANGTVSIFYSIGVVPDVSSKPTSEVVTGTSTTLEGTVNPDGTELTTCQVEYGTSPSYGQTAPCSSVPSGDTSVTVTAQATGLLPGAAYYYRFDAANAKGSNQGLSEKFVTPGMVDAQPAFASDVSQFAATLNATVDPGVLPTSYHFVYGTTDKYGSVVPVPDLYTQAGEKELVSQSLSGLRAGTTYHFAVVINDAAGTFTGPDETLTTPFVPLPVVSTGGTDGVTEGSVTLSGTIDPQGWNTTYHFEYGTSAAYGLSWPTVDTDMGALDGAQPVALTIENLQPATTYHYRLVATDPGGTTYGADQSFTTRSYPVSVIQVAPIGAPLGIPPVKASKPKSKPKRKTSKHAKSKKKSKRRK